MKLLNHVSFWTDFLRGRYPVADVNLTTEEKGRVEYYCKLKTSFDLGAKHRRMNSIPLINKTGYAYDWYKMADPKDTRPANMLFGDIQYHPDYPAFCKSRPIQSSNQNNVLLPLNTSRHLIFVHDPNPTHSKKNSGIWRGAAYKELRKNFLYKTLGIDTVDAKDTSRNSPKNCIGQLKNVKSISEQLKHKFIFAIEGNDVASNLKWIMSSKSLAVMPDPNFETWFCEGLLIPNQHYIQVKSDFSNIEETLQYFIDRPLLCSEMVSEANEYARKFYDLERQFSIGRRVIEEYFRLAGTVTY